MWSIGRFGGRILGAQISLLKLKLGVGLSPVSGLGSLKKALLHFWSVRSRTMSLEATSASY